MTSFILKLIGIFAMLCDHIGDILPVKYPLLNFVGRIAFPIFAFQITNSYIHTKDIKKFMLKLLIFAFISQVPFTLFLSTFSPNNFSLNIFFTFLLGLSAILIYDKCKYKIVGIISAILISILGQFIKVDYGMFGILLIFSFYIFKDNLVLLSSSTILLTFLVRYLPEIIKYPTLYAINIKYAIFLCFSLIFICLYNKKQGPKLKYFFYIFYPLHLLILFLIKIYII